MSGRNRFAMVVPRAFPELKLPRVQEKAARGSVGFAVMEMRAQKIWLQSLGSSYCPKVASVPGGVGLEPVQIPLEW